MEANITPVFERVSLGGQAQKCKDCGDSIRWVRTRAGKRMPLNFLSSESGDFVVIGYDDGVPVVGYIPVDADKARIAQKPMFRCQFESCKKNYRKKDVNAKPVRRHTARFKEYRRDIVA
jgi:hypothetical protein